ncbi:MAG: hypothetical protein LWW81_03735 [Rhodocyclales bacterium]|nr:hypothetical protein [Rhodocyclales bacterium]
MFKEFADDKHKSQAEEFIMELGKFVLQFERVCDAMRFLIMFSLRSQGLKNPGIEQVIVGDKAAAELQILLGAIYCELPEHDESDRNCVKSLLKDFKEITEKRNILLHSSWNLGNKASDQELYAATVRFRAKQNKGSGTEVHGYTASYIRDLSNQLKRVQVLLQRLQYCITQKGFKFSSEFEKPL